MSKIILDLCGGSGSWSKPFADAGYDVRIISLPEHDVRNFHWDGPQVFGILAAPPCESFSNARRGHPTYNKAMNRDEGLEIVRACLRIIKECKPTWWALENPATGDLKRYLGDPAMTFQPYEFGDGWAKKTALWGNFRHPAKKYTSNNRPAPVEGLYVRPGRGYPSLAFQHKSAVVNIPQFEPFILYVQTDYDLRSITPPAFARAFYEANKGVEDDTTN